MNTILNKIRCLHVFTYTYENVCTYKYVCLRMYLYMYGLNNYACKEGKDK